MFARCVTRFESRRWPSPWRETCSTSAPANEPRETSVSPQSVLTSSGPSDSNPGSAYVPEPVMIAIGMAREYPHKLPGDGSRRRSRRDEVREFASSVWAAFHGDMRTPTSSRWERVLEPERTLAIRDRGRIVAGTGIFSAPPRRARRRGAGRGGHARRRPPHATAGAACMSTLMRRQLADVHEAGREAVAALWASEPVIYGRFGYGLARIATKLDVARGSARLRRPSDARGRPAHRPPRRCRRMREVHEALWPTIPGMLDRDGPWWEDRIEDHEEHREGAQPLRAAVTEDAYALYAVKQQWDDDGPAGEVVVLEALATTARGARPRSGASSSDSTSRAASAGSWRPSDHPLMHMVANAQDVPHDDGYGLWVRLVDLPRALAERTYARAVRGRARGRRRRVPVERRPLGAALGRHDRHLREDRHPAGLELGPTELGAAYLGGTRLEVLARAGRVRELRPGALAAAEPRLRGRPRALVPGDLLGLTER